MASISWEQYSRVNGSSFSKACGAKPGSSRRRAPLWKGGWDEMGGAMPMGAMSGGRFSVTTSLRDVKFSVWIGYDF